LKLWTASIFYKLLNHLSCIKIPSDTGDFRLVDRKVIDAFRAMPEQDRFVRGMFAWLGFRQTEVAFHRLPRPAGETKYPLWKMVRLAVNGVIGFSDAPLRLALWAGGAVSLLAFVYGLSVIGRWALSDPSLERGWSSTIVVIAALGGANMLMTGVVGLYVGRIYAEAKGRPLYIVERAAGFDDASATARRPVRRQERA